jgi:hypothetical protein
VRDCSVESKKAHPSRPDRLRQALLDFSCISLKWNENLNHLFERRITVSETNLTAATDESDMVIHGFIPLAGKPELIRKVARIMQKIVFFNEWEEFQKYARCETGSLFKIDPKLFDAIYVNYGYRDYYHIRYLFAKEYNAKIEWKDWYADECVDIFDLYFSLTGKKQQLEEALRQLESTPPVNSDRKPMTINDAMSLEKWLQRFR